MKSRFIVLPLVLALMVPALAFAAPAMPDTDLSVGARGEGVTWLQTFLLEKGQGPATEALRNAGVTGYFGQLTRAAVAEFQQARGITPAYGYFGAKTRAHVKNDTVTKHAPTFSGEIEAVNTGCFADGICSVTIDGKEVILLAGLRVAPVPPVGSLIGVDSIGDLEGRIGATAHVYATTTTEGDADYTLYGDTQYYVEVEKDMPNDGNITVRGTIGCLPPADPTKPTITLCAFGIKADDGTYYALKADTDLNVMTFETEGRVEVTGMLSKGSNPPWNSTGTITVTKVTKI